MNIIPKIWARTKAVAVVPSRLRGVRKDEQYIGPPTPPEENECCESGCVDCVWTNYVRDLSDYYNGDKKKLKEAVQKIPDIHVRTFMEIELDLKK
jgi:hypothetical protein